MASSPTSTRLSQSSQADRSEGAARPPLPKMARARKIASPYKLESIERSAVLAVRIKRKTFLHNEVAEPGRVVSMARDLADRLIAKGLADVLPD